MEFPNKYNNLFLPMIKIIQFVNNKTIYKKMGILIPGTYVYVVK